MAAEVYILTTSNISKIKTNGHDFSNLSGSGWSSLGCIVPDTKLPSAWVYDYTNRTLRQINVVTFSFSGKEIALSSEPRSIQVDRITGDVFTLHPYSSSTNSSPKIMRHKQSGTDSQEINVLKNGAIVQLRFPLDMKIDVGRRHIWIADSGNNRIIRANIETMEIEREYSGGGILFPSTIAIEEGSGNAVVRAYDDVWPAASSSSYGSSSSSVSSNSSSSSTTESSTSVGSSLYERIWVLSHDSIEAEIQVQASYSWLFYSSRNYLHLSDEDIEVIASTEATIPLPASSSIVADHARYNVWWLSSYPDNKLYLLNLRTMVATNINLYSILDGWNSIDVDLSSGYVYIGGWQGPTGMLIDVDRSCSEIHLLKTVSPSNIRCVFINQIPSGVTVFSWEGVSMVSALDSSSSSSSVDQGGDLTTIRENVLFKPEVGSKEVIVVDESQTHLKDGTVYIYSKDKYGISSFRRAADPDIGKATFTDPSSIIKLPIFSWDIQAYKRKTALFIASSTGSFFKIGIDYDEPSAVIIDSVDSGFSSGITGMSISPDSGNAYISGDRKVAKINLDYSKVVTPSVSSGSSQSSESPEESFVIAALSEELDIADPMVVWHAKSPSVICVSPSSGSILHLPSVDCLPNDVIETRGFESPKAVVRVGQNNPFIIVGGQSIYSWDQLSQPILVRGIPSGEIVGFDLSESLELAVCTYDSQVGVSSYRILSSDMYKILSGETSRSVVYSSVVFTVEGKAVISYESNGKAFYLLVDLISGSTTVSLSSLSRAPGVLVYDKESQSVLDIGPKGQIWWVCQFSSSDVVWKMIEIGSLDIGVLFAKVGVASSEPVDYIQRRVRVYVGSREWKNDMWDSGEIRSSLKSIAYGGGDNLVPGQTYYVHVLVYTKEYGWSSPQIRAFIVPMES